MRKAAWSLLLILRLLRRIPAAVRWPVWAVSAQHKEIIAL